MAFSAWLSVPADDEMSVVCAPLRAYLDSEGYSYQMPGHGLQKGNELMIEVVFESEEAARDAAERWITLRYLNLDTSFR
jgi:hypothetical protein